MKKINKELKTKLRKKILFVKNRKNRIGIRYTKTRVIASYIFYDENIKQDKIICSYDTISLLNKVEGIKVYNNKVFSYFCGLKLGELIKEKKLEEDLIIDIGLKPSIKESNIYYLVKGLIDKGVSMRVNLKMIPKEIKNLKYLSKASIDFYNENTRN